MVPKLGVEDYFQGQEKFFAIELVGPKVIRKPVHSFYVIQPIVGCLGSWKTACQESSLRYKEDRGENISLEQHCTVKERNMLLIKHLLEWKSLFGR